MGECETLTGEDRSIRLEEGFLTDRELRETSHHAASCPPCSEALDLVLGETTSIREALSEWTESLPVTRRNPVRRRIPILALTGVAAAAALLAAFLLGGEAGPVAPGKIAEIPVAPAPQPGMIPPPCFAQLLLYSDFVLVARVEKVEGEGERKDLTVRIEKALQGSIEAVPKRIRLVVPRGISEIGVQVLTAKVADPALLLLKRRKRRLELTTGNAYSVVGPGAPPFLMSADPKYEDFKALETVVARCLRLRRTLAAKPWKDQDAVMAGALRGDDPLAREMALDWYARGRRGWPTDDVAVLAENRKLELPLKKTDLALLHLSGPVEDGYANLSWSAQDLLMLQPRQWVRELGWYSDGPAVWRMMNRIGERGFSAHRDELIAELRRAGGREGYLAAGLLYRFEDASRLGRILDHELNGKDIAWFKGWDDPPVWPPVRYLSLLAGKEFADEVEARKWVREVAPR